MTEITGAVAVVTGRAAGIGRGIAEQLLAEGAAMLLGLDGVRSPSLLGEKPPSVLPTEFDLRREADHT